jgi:hypothetical protein
MSMRQDASDPNEIRRVVQHVVDRSHADAAYKQQLQQDPRGTLVEAGLSEQAASHMVQYELPDYGGGTTGEVSGYMSPQPCDGITCIITSCTWFTG